MREYPMRQFTIQIDDLEAPSLSLERAPALPYQPTEWMVPPDSESPERPTTMQDAF
jgi:hypothetical protein